MSCTAEAGKLDCTRGEKELVCPALGSVMVTPRNRGSMINGNIVAQFGESVDLDADAEDAKRPVYLVWAGTNDVLWSTTHASGRGWPQLREASIPNGVRELSDECFRFCNCLYHVSFGSSSSLERIGVSCFTFTNVCEVSIPDSVRELCDRCFECHHLCRVAFGSSSSLERIGIRCFKHTNIRELSIPDSVRELCDQCFWKCKNLCSVTFGSSSSLERIGIKCFAFSRLVDFEIPRSVTAIGGGAFGECPMSDGIMIRDGCCFSAFAGLVFANDCQSCCCSYGALKCVTIPDSVRELCDYCFSECWGLSLVTFSPSSSLERIGVSCFEDTEITELSIPDSVRELCDRCCNGCPELERLTFSPSSCLERIGARCFGGCKINELRIPDSVRELGDECFKECSWLSDVIFSPSSSLERIGFQAFDLTDFSLTIKFSRIRSILYENSATLSFQ